MKFIRKGGRIIPIRDKQESSLKKVDIATGAMAGMVPVLLFKKKKIAVAAGFASATIGAATTYARLNIHNKLGTAIKEDMKSSFMKAGAYGLGFVSGIGIITGANKLMKLRKLRNARYSIP